MSFSTSSACVGVKVFGDVTSLVVVVGIELYVAESWQAYIEATYRELFGKVICEVNFHRESTFDYMVVGFRDGQLRVTGIRIGKILPKVSGFAFQWWKNDSKRRHRQLKDPAIFERFKGLYVGRSL